MILLHPIQFIKLRIIKKNMYEHLYEWFDIIYLLKNKIRFDLSSSEFKYNNNFKSIVIQLYL